MKDMKDKKFAVVGGCGVVSNGMEPSELIATLLEAFLQTWDREVKEIDVAKAGEKVLALMGEISDGEDDGDMTLDDALERLFGDG